MPGREPGSNLELHHHEHPANGWQPREQRQQHRDGDVVRQVRDDRRRIIGRLQVEGPQVEGQGVVMDDGESVDVSRQPRRDRLRQQPGEPSVDLHGNDAPDVG